MDNLILVIGKKALTDAALNKSLIKATVSSKDQRFIDMLKKNHVEVEINNDYKYYEKIACNTNHQFALGYVESNTLKLDLKSYLEKYNDDNQLVVMLDSIEDPYNFGAIIRSAEALGVKAIIYKKNNQCPVNQTVIKVSSGAISNINLIEVVNLSETIRKMKESGFWIYASCLDKDAKNAFEITYDKKTLLILGNEDSGISQLVQKNSDFKVYIPLIGKTQSLNVSVAAGILIAQIIRKQK